MRTHAGLVLLCAGFLTTPCSAQKRLVAIDDLYRFDAPTAAVLSTDGQRLAYSRQWNDPATKETRYSLWTVEGSSDKAKAVEPDQPDARAPLFSPDGKWIVFHSKRPRPDGWTQTPAVPLESDAAVDIWLIPSAGGPAIPLAPSKKPYGRVFHDNFYGRTAFSPDGKRLVFVADNGVDPRTKQEIDNDVQIVRPDQGEGYTGYGAAQIWVAHLDEKPGKFAASRIERLTKDEVWYGDPQWSPDGTTIAVHANRTTQREAVRFSINRNFEVWTIDVETHKSRQLTTGVGPDVSPRFSPDGKRLACLNVPRKGSHRDVFNLAIIDLESAEPKTTIVFDHHGPTADKAPQPPPAFPLPTDCWEDDKHLIYNAETGVDAKVVRIDTQSGKGTIVEPSNKIQKRIQELTPAGHAYLKECSPGETSVVTWKSDNNTIEGLLTLPPAEAKVRKPYKLVVFPHGGPHGRASRSFNFTAEILAAHGYAVFQPNFRGSAGYGQKFIDADRDDLGGGDMRDIMSGVDHLIAKEVVDPKRLFVYGTSYGGYMTTWLVGHSNRFRAAVAQNAVTDLNMMWGLSDIQSWTEWEFNGKPWQVPEKMRKHSPLTYADKVTTPTLILHARDDRRCPLPMGKAFYQALADREVPTQMVIYPNEGHGIRQPKHMEDVLRRLVAWFEKYGG